MEFTGVVSTTNDQFLTCMFPVGIRLDGRRRSTDAREKPNYRLPITAADSGRLETVLSRLLLLQSNGSDGLGGGRIRAAAECASGGLKQVLVPFLLHYYHTGVLNTHKRTLYEQGLNLSIIIPSYGVPKYQLSRSTSVKLYSTVYTQFKSQS